MSNLRKKLLFVTGTRAEYGLARATLLELAKLNSIDLRTLATGMHTLKKYGLTLNEIKKDIKINCIVPIKESDDMITALTKEINGIQGYVQKEKIDTIIIIGDRDEAFAAATVGVHLGIPVIHVSGGDVSGPSVDHYLRNAITVFSKLHLVQTEQAAKNVIRLGADPKTVHVVGSMGLHGLNGKNLKNRNEIARGIGLDAKMPWYLIAYHPTIFSKTGFQEQIEPVLSALKDLGEKSEKIIIYPNSDMGSDVFIKNVEKLRKNSRYHIFRNLGRESFLAALYHSEAMIGNSSAGLFEAGFLKKPFINIGERQAGREQGPNVMNVGYKAGSITKAVKNSSSAKFKTKLANSLSLYQGGDVAGKIADIIEKFLHE